MRGREVPVTGKRPVKGLIAAPAATPCSPPPGVVRPPSPARPRLQVVAAGADGPVAGLRVCAASLSGAQTCAPTGPDGIATFALPAGAYQIRSETPASQRRKGELVGADLYQGDASVRLEFEKIRRITGTYTDTAKKALAQAPVCATPLALAATVCEKSKADGTYALDVTPGLYKLFFGGAPGLKLLPQWSFGRVNSGEADVVDVRSGDSPGNDVALRAGVTIAGTIPDLGGQPVKKAQVCTHRFEALPWECERTDDHGHYVALREPDTYWVWVIPSDDDALVMQWYDDASVGVAARSLTLDRDRVVDQVLSPGPSIVGHVRASDGSPVYHAFVCVDTPFPTGRICRPTDAAGAYRVTTRPESYLVQVLPPDGSDLLPQFVGGGRTWLDAATVTLRNQDRTVDVTLARGLKVSGVLRSQAGVPLEGASVNVSDAQGFLTGTYTDETGLYALAVPAGQYTFDFFAPFPSQVVSVQGRTVAVDRAMTIDVVLPDANP